MHIARFALPLALALAGCGGSSLNTNPDGGGGGGDQPDLAVARPPLGMPITAQKGTWTWVDFPDAVCDDGSPTGVGVKLTDSKNLMIFFNGGGACWDYTTCALLNTSTHGPFGAAQFANLTKQNALGGIFGDDPSNPVAGWNMVFIPYCTGDVHAGDNIVTYMGGNAMKTIHHKGHANALAYFKRLAATWPNPDNLLVSGSSAGGFGAAINYDTARTYWPTGKSYLLDDSGPPLVGESIRNYLRDAWFKSWNINAGLGQLCPNCQDDLSSFLAIISKKYPNDRMALLSSEQDATIRGFYSLTADLFKTDLYELATTRIDPLPNFKYFFETGQRHTMVGDLKGHMTGGVVLADWLKQELADDPKWTSVKP